MSLNDPRKAFREAVIPMFALLLLHRHNTLSLPLMHTFLARNDFIVHPRVLRRIVWRLALSGACDHVPGVGKRRELSFRANHSTFKEFEKFLALLTDFGRLAYDYRDGRRHFWPPEDGPFIL